MHATFTTILSAALLTSSIQASTLPFNPRASGAVCSPTATSCSGSGTTNTCCLANNIIVFAQQWLQGYCATKSCQIDNVPQDWTVHGGWPNTCAGGQTNGCAGPTYDDITNTLSAVDSDLVDQMNQHWVSYTGDNNVFWAHEWEKHGRCFTPAAKKCFPGFEDGQDLDKYFSYVLGLRNQFPIGAALENANITPGGSYTKTQFRNALTAAYPGLKLQLICVGGYISEIYIALYATPNGAKAGAPLKGASDNCPTTFNY
ncbi:ribonuclease T2-like protein [Fimicolochytrium jonesii]|uniref:ribonuclease T2-like protein n=1 Tax=Fimicolochytrium jonesii TaxID=1396493 RepID=UPI0022FEAB78|nr:ribonuclease T2-like protein [Fimicolochytrium jonesii]KAI8821292.1 ribonuclease T2-like protein [Fimicolochytrium jonesii]